MHRPTRVLLPRNGACDGLFTYHSLITAFIGAVVLLVIVRLFSGGRARQL
ncbi:GlsB/YeaQ/YmgE family stress response membrane protein [Paraburkholderia sp.]